MLNYFNGLDDVEEWDTLPEYQKERLSISLEQADAGLGEPVEDVTKQLRVKYGLNG